MQTTTGFQGIDWSIVFKKGWWILPVVALAVLAADQTTKFVVTSSLELYESWAPVPALAGWFDIQYVTNTGSAFGMFQNGAPIFVVISIIVSAAILIYHATLPDGQSLMRFCMGLQLGGALGNLFDRFLLGYVVDFLNFHFWPVFNVADMSIVCGVALLALVLLYEDRQERSAFVVGKNAGEWVDDQVASE